MYTESDLREMLRASADRVPEQNPSSDVRLLTRIDRARGRRRRRVIVPISVAAASVAVVAGAVALLEGPGGGHTTVPAGATSAAVRPAPQVRSSTSSPGPTLTVPVVDEVRVDTLNSTENYVGKVDGDHGQQVITSQLADGRAANLVIAPASAFSDRRVSRAHPVTIAGTTGYYDVLRLFPLSDDGAGGSAPTGTIVFRTPDGHWAFAWLQAGTDGGNQAGTPVDVPAAIVAGFDSLHATFAPGSARTPLRVGYLPTGATFDDADLSAVRSELIVASITALDGDKQMEISLLATKYARGGGGFTDGTTCIKAVGCVVSRHRAVPGGFELTVQGTNYSAAETERVLHGVTVATEPNDPSTHFLLTEAVG